MNLTSGQQPLEALYLALHETIIDHVTAGAGKESRRKTEVLNSCKALDDLNAALSNEGHNLIRQQLYL